MKTRILYIFTRTPLHVGAGSSVGAIDQPIQRERHTGFPIIPGSSIKGVLRDAVTRDSKLGPMADRIFGKQEDAGRVSVGEAKVLAFPVRSAKGSFAFVTCPLTLERFRRDSSNLQELKAVPEPVDMSCFAGDAVTISRSGQTGIVLEEYKFGKSGAYPQDWEKALLGLLDDPVWKVAVNRLVLLSNGDFSHFARNACEVGQHVAIKPDTGTAKPGALFNSEAVPAETLFFAPFTPLARAQDDIESLAEFLERKPVLQFGGDSTTGLGFCTIRLA